MPGRGGRPPVDADVAGLPLLQQAGDGVHHHLGRKRRDFEFGNSIFFKKKFAAHLVVGEAEELILPLQEVFEVVEDGPQL